MATESKSITAEEYAALPAAGPPTELVRGEVVEMNLTQRRHSYVCGRVTLILGDFAEDRGLGFVGSNDGGVVTQRDPDTVRGPDVAFFSVARVPPGTPLEGYVATPDLAFEVRSPSDRVVDILAKISELLAAGVGAVVLLDPEDAAASVFRTNANVTVHRLDDVLELPEPFTALRHTVRHWLGRALDR